MEKDSPGGVCGWAQIHKRFLFTPQTLICPDKETFSSLPEPEFPSALIPTQRLADPNLSLSGCFQSGLGRGGEEIVGGQGGGSLSDVNVFSVLSL